MGPLVTISIPLYKCEDFLEKCLDSVRMQTYDNLEVTLINDQTPDCSVQIATKYIERYELTNWKIYHLETNSGLSVVRNKGIDTANGKYLFFLDSDDTITPDCISKLVDISEDTGAEMTISQLECEQQSTGEKSICIPIRTPIYLLETNKQVFEEYTSGKLVSYAVNKLFKTKFLVQNKLYFVPGLFAQDELWSFHCALKMSRVAVCKDITYTYYLHDKSVIHNRTKRNFDNWFTIGQYIDQAYKEEQDPERAKKIIRYLTNFKASTLQMNWKAQKNEALWKENYTNYLTLSKIPLSDYIKGVHQKNVLKNDLLYRLPVNLGFKLFKWRYER